MACISTRTDWISAASKRWRLSRWKLFFTVASLWAMVGDAFVAGTQQPDTKCLMLASVEDPAPQPQQQPLLAVPTVGTSDQQLWDTRHLGDSTSSASLWPLLCPAGYQAIGFAVNSGPGSGPNHAPPAIANGETIGPPNSQPVPIAVLRENVTTAFAIPTGTTYLPGLTHS